MTAIPEPDLPSKEGEPIIDDNVQFVGGSGDLRIEDGKLIAPEFIGSDYGWTRLQYASFFPESESQTASATLVYGETRRVGLTYTDDGHAITIDVEFDKKRDGQMWQRAVREVYDDFEVAFKRYTEVVKEGLIDVSPMEMGSPSSNTDDG
ncbi:hypothetical protein [Halobiforma nitratireducens]|uniref:Uncharacterized protein n=1 Tax=Halobiforma nitratireducens JCM 10879 TaxID=1227454 RepID=M0MP60_9EURY|nr:hypothetical protein [Halobiforma nitratireducens]EMA46499.1 hypothetical protein C446_01478 [Halobiforma nitratireducens JCM 10879]